LYFRDRLFVASYEATTSQEELVARKLAVEKLELPKLLCQDLFLQRLSQRPRPLQLRPSHQELALLGRQLKPSNTPMRWQQSKHLA
jgi:hypothetical protein